MKSKIFASMIALLTGIATAGDSVKLFTGEDLSQWTMGKEGAWVSAGGELQPNPEKGKAGGYIWTKEKFENFVLTLEFKMSEKCNSGVFFRTDPKNAVQGGFEIQVMDTHGKAEMGKHDCGALYDAFAPLKDAARPAGEWNTMTVSCNGSLINVELNGEIVVAVSIDEWTEGNKNPDGSKNKFKTALKDIPRNNHIGLQYHGHPVWFRNIKLKRL